MPFDDDEVNERLGTVVADRYELLRVIGVGGMGTVYEARHLFTERLVGRGALAKRGRWAMGVTRAAVAVTALAACGTEPATQLVVVVDSDLAVPDQLDEVRIRVLDAAGELATDRFVRLGSGEGEYQLPADFGVAPRDPSAGGRVTIELHPILLGDTLFVRRAITGFREGHALRLDMLLASACVDRTPECDAALTCAPEGCVDPAIDPATLAEFTP